MANRQENRPGVHSQDPLPNVGVRGVPGQKPDSGAPKGGIRMLDSEEFLTHYYHLQIRREAYPEARACCSLGAGEILVEVETVLPEPELDGSSGTDEEGASASPQPSGPQWS